MQSTILPSLAQTSSVLKLQQQLRGTKEQNQARGSKRDGRREPAGFSPAECTRMMLAPGAAEGAELREVLAGGWATGAQEVTLDSVNAWTPSVHLI